MDGKYNSKIIMSLIIFGILSLITLGTLILCLVSLLLLRTISKVEESVEESHSYKYYTFDQKYNESTVGFVDIFTHLEEGEFISYRESNGERYVLISNFGSEEYKCFGKCFCGEERRIGSTTSHSTIRYLLYLVIATSSYLALDTAKKHFKTECEEIFDTEKDDILCNKDSIISEVDYCETTHPLVKVMKEEEEEEEEVEEYEDKKKMDLDSFLFDEYICRGNCVKINDITRMHFSKEMAREQYDKDLIDIFKSLYGQIQDFNCNSLELSGETVNSPLVDKNQYGANDAYDGEYLEQAKWVFATEYLQEFCQVRSAVPLPGKTMENTELRERFPICFGYDMHLLVEYHDDDSIFPTIPMSRINPSVQCVKK